ncbi:MAG: glycosyltransferase family 4 protein, partial [Candidatus Harrisonbacteria bacterium]|nr:glycosyltransferase family 4 protein [Candidatus Harrisonbacteria bacterium]
RVGIFYPFWKMLFKRADGIQAISNYLGDFAMRHGARVKPVVIPNGVAAVRVNSEKRIVNSDSRRRKQQNETVIITTSRLVQKNGIDVLIRAVAELGKSGGSFRLRIAGAGPEEAKLRALAEKLGVKDRIEFLGQVVPERIPELLRDADFLKDPGIVGLKDCTGVFAKLNDPKDLAAKIRLLSSNALLREAIVKNAKKLVERNYQWDGIAERMREVMASMPVKK